MFNFKNTNIDLETKMADLVFKNPSILLMMEHFEMDIVVKNNTISQLCSIYKINHNIFIAIVDLYFGNKESEIKEFTDNDISLLLKFLKNSHDYFKKEKYPEIQNLINATYKQNNIAEIKLIESFFDEYFKEVLTHLDFEEKVVYPYFSNLVNKNVKANKQKNISTTVYNKKHTDIEYKLYELKNLLIKHVASKQDGILRRKLLISLSELENELNIHTIVEEKILIPLMKKIENKK